MDVNGVRSPAFLKGPLMMVGWKKEEDRLSVKDGVTLVDYPGIMKDVTVRCEEDTIRIERRSFDPNIVIKRKGNNIEVHKHGNNGDIRITREDNLIRIDRTGSNDDVTIAKNGNSITVDRPGLENDVKITGAGENPLPYPVYITWDGEVIEQV